MNKISERIDEIITARSSSLAKLKAASETLAQCSETVRLFEKLQAKVSRDPAYLQLFGKPEILERIKGVSTAGFHATYQSYRASLAHLTERFARKELHISFIGRAGQGKSLVMQNISGLSGNVIPSAEGADCTGAKSIITNDPAAAATKARIEFFSQMEMIEIVNTYLANIFYGEYKVGSVDEIKNLPLAEMKSRLDFTKVRETELLAQLEKYVLHVAEFESSLGTTREVPERDIEKYVAQYKSDNPSEKYFTYLGVKLANIICKFPEEDAGKIVLVDTIGIGATSLGTEDKMLDTVENDSDAVVFMFRPDAFRPRLSNDEINIIDEVSKRISPEYAKEMFFWVLNRVTSGKGENAKYMPELKAQISGRNFPVALVLEVDCKSPDAVESELLTPILRQLSHRVGNVDELLITRLNELGERLYEEYRAIADAIDKILVGAANDDVKRALFTEIEGAYKTKVLNTLRDLYIQKYFKIREHSCAEWEQASKLALKSVFKSIPSKDKIIALLNDGTINQFNAVEFCTDLMRIQIINRFMELDSVLEVLVHDTKMEAVHILADDDKGRLGKVLPLENLSPEEWLAAFMTKTDCAKKYPLLTKALTSLKNFTINVQGFLIYEIRRNLDVIDFSLQPKMPEINAGLAEKEQVAEEIITWLRLYAEKVHEGLEVTLKKLNSVPNKARFAALKDFYDRAAYSGRDETLSVTTEWRYLYEDWMSVIWAEKYKAHFSLKGQAEEWDDMVAQFKAQNKKETFAVR